MHSSPFEAGSNGIACAGNIGGTGRGKSRVRWCGVPVRVALVLPPCVPAGEEASMEVHLEWDPRSPLDAEFELVGAVQGTQVFSKFVSRGGRHVVRVDWTPKGVGVVDVFFLGSKSDDQVAVGELGHLLVLPAAVCQEGNAIFAKQVAAGSADQGGSLFASIQMERTILKILKTLRSTRENSSNTMMKSIPGLMRIMEHLRSSETAQLAALPANGMVKGEDSNASVLSVADVQAMDHLSVSEDSTWTLHIKKYVWRSDFMSLCLDLDVFFQLLLTRKERVSSPGEHPVGGCQGRPGDLDVAIKLILGNILLHLRKFEAWEFIAHVLQRCAEFEVDVCWGQKDLVKDDLTGSRLQELANNESGARGMLDC
eukprot:evm.model.scf_1455.2 EVM.evm.TU.scf_1455.2   scf_1455:31854-34180(+)